MTIIRALYPIYCSDSGVGHICLSVCEHMSEPGFDVRLTVPSTEPSDRREFVIDAVPPALRTLGCRRPLRGVRHWCTERSFLRSLRRGGVAYIWPGSSRRLYEQIKAMGRTVIMERINCHRATARRILDEAYDRLGWPAAHGITDQHTACEQEKLDMADLVFCPSPLVRQSMLDAGVPAEKLLSTSYGWSPARFQGRSRDLPPAEGITVVFVGLACVRKGIHLLLEAWHRARLQGRLVVVGDIAPDVAERCADHLDRPDVLHVPHCSDVSGLFRSADVFAFPTLEEGSPLVSYEAMASNLAIVTSPMGAGEVIRDGREGIVLDPYARDGWVEALHRLARDADLRAELAGRARQRAEHYHWPVVGRRRGALLKAALRGQQASLAQPVGAR